MFAVTTGGGLISTFTDVCKTQVGTATVPIPYPDIVSPSQGSPAASKVIICGSPAANKKTVYKPSSGDESGAIGGVVSGSIKGEVKLTAMSTKVKIEGSPAVRLSMPSSHNNNNSIGLVAAPSQTKVLIMS